MTPRGRPAFTVMSTESSAVPRRLASWQFSWRCQPSFGDAEEADNFREKCPAMKRIQSVQSNNVFLACLFCRFFQCTVIVQWTAFDLCCLVFFSSVLRDRGSIDKA